LSGSERSFASEDTEEGGGISIREYEDRAEERGGRGGELERRWRRRKILNYNIVTKSREVDVSNTAS
jgi:hypothetical protein